MVQLCASLALLFGGHIMFFGFQEALVFDMASGFVCQSVGARGGKDATWQGENEMGGGTC